MHAAYECACRHGDSGEIALSLQHLAGQAYFAGEYEQAVKLEEEALGLWQELGDARGTGLLNSAPSRAGRVRDRCAPPHRAPNTFVSSYGVVTSS